MGIEDLRGLVQGLMFGTYADPGPFAKAATVTPPDSEPVQTAVIWLNRSEASPGDSAYQREEQRRVVAIRRDHVPSVPRGTLVACAALLEDEPQVWVVDATESVAPDHQRVAVIPAPMDT